MRYEVRWKEFWKSVTKRMALLLIFSTVGTFAFRYLTSGFDLNETFGNVSFLEVLGLIFGCWAFFAIFTFFIAFWLRCAHITIREGIISGRNYWGRKKSFPLKYLKSIDIYSANGVKAVVANGGSFGKVFIYYQTEKLHEIIEVLEANLPGNMEA
ncbi:MAG: hypothetical protein CMM07_17300 [Rhodopirellula sp.]|nr:hypothetical protein [Rhodopirellula sp.]